MTLLYTTTTSTTTITTTTARPPNTIRRKKRRELIASYFRIHRVKMAQQQPNTTTRTTTITSTTYIKVCLRGVLQLRKIDHAPPCWTRDKQTQVTQSGEVKARAQAWNGH
ncbi:hypothetical protein E2C01_034736 [Portunus trituberculatus]|uniref:Uncharacterized protein n=1 Tax=Portunus trituberculatus TaxID=210409 RepID=A0A5B7F2B2_PORTR|nr:hypothetical protein [Portunus trituberculatus]